MGGYAHPFYTWNMKRFILLVVLVGVLFGIYYFWLEADEPGQQQLDSDTTQETADEFDKSRHSIDESGSLWWIVNRDRPLPEDYTPSSLSAPEIKLRWHETAESMQVDTRLIEPLEQLYADAKSAGHNLMLISGFRSEEYQAELYQNYVRQHGQEEADRFSAKPGTSEHQTGLVVDLGRVDGECEIEQCFGDTKEGKWLADNAYRYGFIIRYLDGKEDETGYMYEPWHFRYVGKDLAAQLHRENLTMEEYFGLN